MSTDVDARGSLARPLPAANRLVIHVAAGVVGATFFVVIGVLTMYAQARREGLLLNLAGTPTAVGAYGPSAWVFESGVAAASAALVLAYCVVRLRGGLTCGLTVALAWLASAIALPEPPVHDYYLLPLLERVLLGATSSPATHVVAAVLVGAFFLDAHSARRARSS
ncbi:hypothetical protein [Actinotalea sp. K2]|uniref:hypothetical protein n=1 Tax=Actinotalea sp. K2 TaxID=2939438 RepID=UPI002016FE5B|nr:hypothetical protein [Actinotalea sp. K2]MCL3861984.1 hypothetical protein [Actinotalea sp. K2]